VTGDFEELGIECSCCGWKDSEGREMRFFSGSHGYLCDKCYESAPSCANDNCSGIAVVRPLQLCRDCYIEEVKMPIEHLVYRSREDPFERWYPVDQQTNKEIEEEETNGVN
jgi:hypothetical protein